MHIHAVTPIRVTDTELARRRDRYEKLSPPGLHVTLQNLPDRSEVPRQLANHEDIRASEAAVATALAALDPTSVDVALPDCVLDPAVGSAADVAFPVVGITQLSAGVVATLGTPFTAVARNRAIADELDRILARYGYAGFEPTRVLNLSFEAIADHEVWNDTVSGLTTELSATPVRQVLNGCSAVDVRPDDSGVTVFDPTKLALGLLALASDHALLPGSPVIIDA